MSATPVAHTREFTIPRPVAEVFPLFSPEGEKLWVPGWDYVNVMGRTDLAEDDVFLTRTHDHAATAAIWIVKAYEPARHRVAFTKVEPGDKVGTVVVACEETASGGTRVAVTYRYVPLSPAGEAFVAAFDADAYADFIAEWRRLLDRHFGITRGGTAGPAGSAPTTDRPGRRR